MPRYKLTIEYDGAPFSGWQRQEEGLPTVQGALEKALEKITGTEITVHGAGRTDAGVHATGQVAHIVLDRPFSCYSLRCALNHHLEPWPVVVLKAEEAEEDFHARFSATGRRYCYVMINRPSPVVLEKGRVWWVRPALCIESMREAARLLVGHHDFSSFRDAECQAASPVKTLQRCDIAPEGERILFHLEAPSFLHRQVRIIVGTLKKIGEGLWDPSHIETILEKKSRIAAGPTAPAEGLYLAEVSY